MTMQYDNLIEQTQAVLFKEDYSSHKDELRGLLKGLGMADDLLIKRIIDGVENIYNQGVLHGAEVGPEVAADVERELDADPTQMYRKTKLSPKYVPPAFR